VVVTTLTLSDNLGQTEVRENIFLYRSDRAVMGIIRKNEDFTVTKGINNLAVLGPYLQGDMVIGHKISMSEESLTSDLVFNRNAQRLPQIARDIQSIVEELSPVYPATNRAEKNRFADELIERIDSDPSLQQRLIEVNEKETIPFLSRNIDHPANSFIMAAIEDWMNAHKSVA
jgi:hypothetical protein